mmetsp:Transcript_47726/g.139118  ORF Transcript_47726/g.139118 Transcript_47726/m.139118 type:complete len:204 (+) Transcript_47726:58-669(+)
MRARPAGVGHPLARASAAHGRWGRQGAWGAPDKHPGGPGPEAGAGPGACAAAHCGTTRLTCNSRTSNTGSVSDNQSISNLHLGLILSNFASFSLCARRSVRDKSCEIRSSALLTASSGTKMRAPVAWTPLVPPANFMSTSNKAFVAGKNTFPISPSPDCHTSFSPISIAWRTLMVSHFTTASRRCASIASAERSNPTRLLEWK